MLSYWAYWCYHQSSGDDAPPGFSRVSDHPRQQIKQLKEKETPA